MGINLIGPINNLGYGITTLNILKALEFANVEVTFWPIGHPLGLNNIHCENEDIPIIKTCIERQDSPNYNQPSLLIWHQNEMVTHIGSPKIGFPIFELDKFSNRERNHLRSLDMIFVCSNWAKDVIKKEIGKDAHVIPLGVDTSIFYPTDFVRRKKYAFLNIGKWEIRKGHDILLEAFQQAFPTEQDVELIMHNNNPFLSEEDVKKWEDYYSSDCRIRLSNERFRSSKEIAILMNYVDCGVFPARAEGWNLEALEMMACGKQVIVTRYSGHTEFCDSFNSHGIKIDELEKAYDGVWFNGNIGNWASLGDSQISQLAEKMRLCYNERKGNFNGTKTAEKFSWKQSARKIKGILSC